MNTIVQLQEPITLLNMFYDRNDGNVIAVIFSKEYGMPVRIILEKIYLINVKGEWLIEEIAHLIKTDV